MKARNSFAVGIAAYMAIGLGLLHCLRETKGAEYALGHLPVAPASDNLERGLAPRYTACSWLRINTVAPSILGQPAAQFSEREFDIYKKTQRLLLKSRYVLLVALRKPEVAKLPAVQAIQHEGDPVRWLASVVKVAFPDDAAIMSVSVTTDNPNEAATLARAVVDAYLMEVVNAERDQSRQRLNELDRAFVEKETAVRHKREDLKKLLDQLGMSVGETLAMKRTLAIEEVAACRRELIQIHAELRAFQRDLAVQQALLQDAAEGRAAILAAIKRLEPSIVAMNESQSAIKRELDRHLREVERLGRVSPDVEMMQADITHLDAVLTKIAREREQLRVNARSIPRVTLVQRADVPESKD